MQIPSDIPPLRSTMAPSIRQAAARSFLYRFLAQMYEYPERETWSWISLPATMAALPSAAEEAASSPSSPLIPTAKALSQCLEKKEAFALFLEVFKEAFGHAARGRCPLNEIEYGDIKADPLFQPHRLADLGAFYHAFGLELTEDAFERLDHLSIECEFMAVLTARELHAIQNDDGSESLKLCRDAQRKFLHAHLARWTPAFARRLSRMAGDSSLGKLADFTREFIREECLRLNLEQGSEDLLLRPIHEAEDALCASCGIHNLPPGASL